MRHKESETPYPHEETSGLSQKSRPNMAPTSDAQRSSQQANITQLLSQGKKEIDKMWQETGIDTIHSITAKSEAFYHFVDKSNNFITVSYPQTIGKNIDESKRSYLIYELSSYTTEKYVKPALAKIQSSK